MEMVLVTETEDREMEEPTVTTTEEMATVDQAEMVTLVIKTESSMETKTQEAETVETAETTTLVTKMVVRTEMRTLETRTEE